MGWRTMLAAVLALAGCALQAGAAEMRTDELSLREAIGASVREAFARGDYKFIEQRYAQALSSDERTASGLQVTAVIRGKVVPPVSDDRGPPGRDDHWIPVENKLQDWARQFPDSSLVAVAQAWAYVGHGWSWRGGGYARSVTPEGFEKLKVYSQRAYDVLKARERVGRKDPSWYSQMLRVALSQGWDWNRYATLLDEATKAFPYNQDIYFEAGIRLSPRWGGSQQAIAGLANYAVEQTRAKDAEAMYARIYWSAGSMIDTELSDPDVDWKRIRTGFEDMVQRFPDSWNLNNYARMACEAQDVETARSVLQRIEGHVEQTAWGSRTAYLRCLQLAGLRGKAAP